MDDTDRREREGYWLGLGVLEELSRSPDGLTSEQVSAILGTRGVKGIGAALSRTRWSLELLGIRLDEALRRRTVRRRSVWMPGPRIRQARHALELARRVWTNGGGEAVPVVDLPDGHPGPVLVLRTLLSTGNAYRIDGGMAELDEILDAAWIDPEHASRKLLGEVFIDRIETAGEPYQAVPDGYGENGIWVRGDFDYANPRVAGAIGTGRDPTMTAWIGEATWAERRIALVDAIAQVEAVRAESHLRAASETPGWQELGGEPFRYVKWIAPGGYLTPNSTPPLRMRLRCWRDVVLESVEGRRIVLREEGLRGDEYRTAFRAINRWRETENATDDVSVVDVRISKSQPRPMPTDGK